MLKFTLWAFPGRYFDSNAPAKVVISLRKSFKNRIFVHSASMAWWKPLLERFLGVLRPQMRPEGQCQGGPRTMNIIFLKLLYPSRVHLASGIPSWCPSSLLFCRFWAKFITPVDLASSCEQHYHNCVLLLNYGHGGGLSPQGNCARVFILTIQLMSEGGEGVGGLRRISMGHTKIPY